MGSKWFFLGWFLPAFQSTLSNAAYFRKFSYISWLLNIPWIIIVKLFGNKLSLDILWRNYLISDLKIKSSTCDLAIQWSIDLWLDLKLEMLTCDLTWTEKNLLGPSSGKWSWKSWAPLLYCSLQNSHHDQIWRENQPIVLFANKSTIAFSGVNENIIISLQSTKIQSVNDNEETIPKLKINKKCGHLNDPPLLSVWAW